LIKISTEQDWSIVEAIRGRREKTFTRVASFFALIATNQNLFETTIPLVFTFNQKRVKTAFLGRQNIGKAQGADKYLAGLKTEDSCYQIKTRICDINHIWQMQRVAQMSILR
jgi:hypothetical protein